RTSQWSDAEELVEPGRQAAAFCRNSVDGRWYGYDDTSAEPTPRGAGSTSSSASDHWLVRLRGNGERDSLGSGGSLGGPPGPLPHLDSHELPVFREEAPKPADTSAPEGSRPQGARGSRGRSASMRSPTKTREALTKVLPLRWSLGAKERSRPAQQTPCPAQLVEYLESGRRPRCSREPIASLVVTPPLAATPPPVSRAAQALGSDGGQRDPGGGVGGGGGGNSPSPRRPEGQSRPDPQTRPLDPQTRPLDTQTRPLDPQTQLRGGILGGHVTHSAPPSRESTLRRARAQTGPPLSPPPQRNQLHGTLNREEGGRSQESLLSLLRPAFLRRPAPSVTAVESLGHANGHPAKMSLSNGTLNGEGPGGRSRAPRRHDQVTATTGYHASGSIPGRTDHHHHPQHHHHHLLRRMVEQPCCDPLQRAQYSTTSLGRQGAGVGVRF
ncbi:hypothetical protein CRUP_019579, partial [Coryphaenoides rupestris]